MIYVTYNDPPSGVFSSQVSDVCNYLNESLDARIRLVCFISIRGFMTNRRKLRSEVHNAIVLPALPKANWWKPSCLVFAFICLVLGEKSVIARNVLAGQIALFAKRTGIIKKVCFDGRGAIAAEWREYEVVHYNNLKNGIAKWERDTVLSSDFHIAVSDELANWWKSEYQYKSQNHVVIPCTLQRNFKLVLPTSVELVALRNKHGFAETDIILIYAGSVSGWQSFGLLEQFFKKLLLNSSRYKLIFLSQPDKSIASLLNQFPKQVTRKWLSHGQVQETLFIGDYGILYREQTVTNQVAAPTKYAEYLSAGLPVLISEHVGDYSEFTVKHKCGFVLHDETNLFPEQTDYATRLRMLSIVSSHFTKDASRASYEQLLKAMQPV